MMFLGYREVHFQLSAETFLPGTIKKNSLVETWARKFFHRMGVYVIPGKISTCGCRFILKEGMVPTAQDLQPMLINALKIRVLTLILSASIPRFRKREMTSLQFLWLNNVTSVLLLQKGGPCKWIIHGARAGVEFWRNPDTSQWTKGSILLRPRRQSP